MGQRLAWQCRRNIGCHPLIKDFNFFSKGKIAGGGESRL
jgi:hypothetical protein